MDSSTALNAAMNAPMLPELSGILYRYRGRYEITATPDVVSVDVIGRRVVVDPMLAAHIQTPGDMALWVVAARNLLLLRALTQPQAATPAMSLWQTAFALAHAASTYSLPRLTPGVVFPRDTLLGCVLSLDWKSLLTLQVPGWKKPFIQQIPNAAMSYTSWMRLGEILLRDEDEDNDSGHGLPQVLFGAEVSKDADEHPNDLGLYWQKLPDTDSPHLRWALDTLTEKERDVYPTLPYTRVLNNLLGFANTDVTTPVSVFGHLGRREVTRHALGIPTFYGIQQQPQVEDRRVNVYVDVSGSMSAYASSTYALIRSLPEATKAYAFSGVVVDFDPSSGGVHTNFTTCYDAVAEHVLASGCSHAVVVTDDDDSLSETNLKLLRERVDIVCVCVRAGVKRSRCFSDAATTTILADS